MNRLLFGLATASMVLLTACSGGQPRYYAVVIDRAPLQALPSTCYAGGTVPATTDTSTAMFETQQWSVWEGADNKLYLIVGDLSTFTLGNAERIRVNGDAIEGGPLSFSTKRDRVDPNRTITTTATVAFTELGGVAKGTLTLDSATTCTNNCMTPSCKVDLKFTGRKLEAEPQIIYLPQ